MQKLEIAAWESGYQYRYLHHPGALYLSRSGSDEQCLELRIHFLPTRIDLTRKIHSLYSQISGKQGKVGIHSGLRLEYFDRTVTLAQPSETYDLSKLNLFPSVNLSYDLGEGAKAKLGYSRRIERTTTFKMTPFPEREHSETLEQGDAELLPEYIDLVGGRSGKELAG